MRGIRINRKMFLMRFEKLKLQYDGRERREALVRLCYEFGLIRKPVDINKDTYRWMISEIKKRLEDLANGNTQ